MAEYIVNKALAQWAEERGYPIRAGVVAILGDYPMAVYQVPTTNLQVLRMQADPQTLTKDSVKALKKLVKPLKGNANQDAKGGTFNIVLTGRMKSAAFREQLDKVIAQVPGLLRESGIRLETDRCCHCGQPDSDTHCFADGIVRPAHSACNSQRSSQLVREVQQNQQGGNYGVAILAALVGAIVGAIPSFISIYVFDYLIGLLFALIPLGAAFAYRRAGGIRSKLMPVILSVVSLTVSAGLALVSLYMVINVELAVYLGGNMPVGMFFELLQVPEMRSEATVFFAQVAIFCGLGIYFAWSRLKQTNQSSIDLLEAFPTNEEASLIQPAE